MSTYAGLRPPGLFAMPPSTAPSATLYPPPPVHFPPLPHTPPRAAPVTRPARPLVRRQPTFVHWAPHKGFRYPYPPGLLSAAAPPIASIISWGGGVTDELPQQLRSELGLDEFNYQVMLRMPPDGEQTRDLKEYLLVWALTAPESLLTHLFHETLDTVLGEKFPWAVFGKAKTLARTGRLPW